MDEIFKRVAHHEATLYYGTDGGKSLVERMGLAEVRMTAVESAMVADIAARKETARKSERKQNIILAGIVTMVATVLMHYVFHFG